jgi:coenzyme F420-0:L-glutamate ligase / coenzyme F420-1:gamma-L-glutamate ligase
MSDFLDLVQTRRSIRRYEDRPVPPVMIERLLTAATWAPSAHNRQPWRFVVIQKPVTREHLAAAMGRKLRDDLAADGVPAEAIEKDVARSYKRISSAPLLILLALTLSDMDTYPDEARQRNEETMAIQSAAMAGQNLLLAAHTLGLGACWLCAPLFCPDVVRRVLALPVDWQPQGLITAGFPAEVKHKTRVPIETRVLYR